MFYRMSLIWDFSVISNLIGFCGEGFRGEVLFSLHPVKGMCYQHDRLLLVLTLSTW
jgi:hypothetical protein